MKVEQRHEGHGGTMVLAAVQGGPQRRNPSASASILCLPPHNPYCSGQNNPEMHLI